MKENLSRMLRSGVALLLVFCMVAGFFPTAAFAAEPAKETLNYVSIGDSMANGYGFTGYYQTSDDRNVYDFMTGKGMYGDGAYPNQFADYLTGLGFEVNHTKLATSAMLAEDLLYLLGGRNEFNDGWNGYKDYVGTYTDEEISAHVQKAVTEADVITMGIGNAAFGAFLMHKLTDALGVFGATLDEDEKVNFEDAIGVLDLDSEQYALVMQVYSMLEAKLLENVPADMAEEYNLEDVVDLMAYTTASFVVNYKLVIEKVLQMNPDVEMVLVGLLNTTYGMNITDENGNVILPFGDVMDSLFSTLNAYMAGLPAVMQAMGVAEDANIYYASQPNPQFICQEFENLLNSDWVAADLRLDGALIRQRNIDAFNGDLAPMIGYAVTGAPLARITLKDVMTTNLSSWEGTKEDRDKQLSVAVYLAIEEAVARSTNTMDIPLSGLVKIAGDLSSVFTELGTPPTTSPEASRQWLLNGLSTEETQGMCKIYGLFKVGNGMSVHPTPAGHDEIAGSVIAAYRNHTVKDETIKNVEILLNELYNLVETYGPEVAAQVWAQWEEYGYVDAVETSLSELKGMLSARYTYYTETALPAINDSVSALTAQKDALTVELGKLNAELAAKKAELAEVIANVEIGSIHTPDINIDVELGNNQQTDVPENDCTVDGEDIKAELEAAVKDLEHAIAVIEALIADIEADIADMIALAEQIAAAVAELEKTMTDVAAAAEELEKAINDVINVVKNSEGVVNQVVNSFEAARDTANAAVKVLTLTIGTAEEMMADVDTMIEKIAADAEALYNKFMTELPGCIEQIPEEAMMLIGGSALLIQQTYEANKEAIDAALKAELAALAEEYGISEQAILAELAKLEQEYADDEAALKAELAAIEAKIAEEVNAKYAEIKADYDAQIEAAKAEAAVKLAALEAELKGYEAELNALAADAAQDVIDGIQAQIDRVNADIATVNEDLACAIEHLENADQIAYEQIVAEVTKVYEETIADLNEKLAELEMAYNEAVAALNEKVAELKAAYDKAVEDLTAVADQAIADLTEELNKTLEELNKALSDKVNGILSAIRGELVDVQKSVEEILKGNLVAVEGLKDALLEMSGDAIVDACEALIDVVMALIEEATTADLVIDDDFKYVAIGDGSAAPESYVEKLTAALNAEAAENGVDEIEMVNYAKAGNTVAAERANLSDVSGADLITVGFSNVEFMSKAIANMSAGAELDWAAAVGEENVQYVDQLLAEVAAKITEAGIEGDYAIMANNAIEAYAYAAVLYATELPELVNEIHAVNPDAVIIIVGMYNPMDGVIINLGENATLDIGEYVDYLVKGVGVHGVAYSILTGNSIYVDAPAVQTVNTDTELGILDLLTLMQTGCASLYPSAVGDDYIAAEIADALNITYVKSEPTGLLGDADGNGVVNTKDAKLIQQYYIHAITENDLDLSVCDVDGNGVINTKDAKLVQQYYIHAISSFPVENV